MTQPSVEPTGEGVDRVEDAGAPEVAVATAALVAAELAFAKAVLASYALWLAEVAAAVFTFGLIDPTAIWALVPSWERRVDVLMRDLEQIARMGWDAAASDLGVAIPFDVTNPVLQDQLRRTRNFMLNTPDDVYQMILKALNENVGDKAAQVRAVNGVLKVTGTANWPARSRVVATTEVHRAFNMGGIALAMNVGAGVTKRWVSKDDTAVRPAHHRADGQVRPVMQPFIVGGEALMAPGDPAGSAWNVINCRCKPRYRRSDDR